MRIAHFWIASIILITLSSSTLKLRNKYEYRSEFDNYYINFTKNHSFELQMYSCTYAIKIIGGYMDSKDTVFLNYNTIYELDRRNNTWSRVSFNSDSEVGFAKDFIKFINRFKKLHKQDNSKILVPIGINRPFQIPKKAQADNW